MNLVISSQPERFSSLIHSRSFPTCLNLKSHTLAIFWEFSTLSSSFLFHGLLYSMLSAAPPHLPITSLPVRMCFQIRGPDLFVTVSTLIKHKADPRSPHPIPVQTSQSQTRSDPPRSTKNRLNPIWTKTHSQFHIYTTVPTSYPNNQFIWILRPTMLMSDHPPDSVLIPDLPGSEQTRLIQDSHRVAQLFPQQINLIPELGSNKSSRCKIAEPKPPKPQTIKSHPVSIWPSQSPSADSNHNCYQTKPTDPSQIHWYQNKLNQAVLRKSIARRV